MKVRIQKVSGTVLYVMLAITLVILGMFFFGGETPLDQRLVADTAMEEPAQTDALIYWMYILFGIAGVLPNFVGNSCYYYNRSCYLSICNRIH